MGYVRGGGSGAGCRGRRRGGGRGRDGAFAVAFAAVGAVACARGAVAATDGVKDVQDHMAARMRVPIERVRGYVAAGDFGVVKGVGGALEVDADGPCASLIEERCSAQARHPRGDGRIFDCLAHAGDQALPVKDRGPWGFAGGFGGRAGAGGTGAPPPRECRFAMMVYSREVDRSLDNDKVLSEACADDAASLCAAELERQRDAASAAEKGGERLAARWLAENGTNATNAPAPAEGENKDEDEDASDAFEVGELDGIVVECLREHRRQVSPACRAGLVARGEREAENVEFDPTVWRACKSQALEMCPGVKPGDGKMWECLKVHAEHLKGACKRAMDVNDEEDAEDFRLDLPLREACDTERMTFCPFVPYGDGRVRKCLEDRRKVLQDMLAFKGGSFASVFNRRPPVLNGVRPGGRRALLADAKDAKEDSAVRVRDALTLASGASRALPVPGFSPECIQVLDERMVRAQDRWEMDANVHEECAAEVASLCAKEDVDEDAEDAFDKGSLGEVMACLQDAIWRSSPGPAGESAPPVSPGCASAVEWQTGAMFEKVDFDPRLKAACGPEIQARCTAEGQLWDEEPVESVIACLYMARGLSAGCRAEVQRQAILSSKSLEFKPTLAYACSADVPVLCPGQAGKGVGGGTLECLRSKVGDRSMTSECHEALVEDLEVASHDVRMEFDLYEACREVEIPEFCGNEMAALLALTTSANSSVTDLTASDWWMGSDEVEQGPGAGDGPSHGEVIQCLRDHFEDMEEGKPCQKQVLELVERQADDARLDSTLEVACADDVAEDNGVCGGVAPGGGKLQLCLRDHLGELTDSCRDHVAGVMRDEAYSIELLPGMRRACGGEVAQRCPNLEPGQGRVAECLKDDLADPQMDSGCLSQLQLLVRSQGRDFLSDWPLAEACGPDLTRLCPGSTAPPGQRPSVNPWACLVEHEKVLPSLCRHQLRKNLVEGLHAYWPMTERMNVCDDALHEFCDAAPPPTTSLFIFDAYTCLSAAAAPPDTDAKRAAARGLSFSDAFPECFELVRFAISDVQADVQTPEFIEKNEEEFPLPDKSTPAGYVDGPVGLLLFVTLIALVAWGVWRCVSGQVDTLTRFGQGVQQGWAEQGRARPQGRGSYARVATRAD